jgi:type IX secretion system PorP/SprF family membrane protein
MKKFYKLFVILFLVQGSEAFAQDPEFTQFYANPLYLNPAFAGSHTCPRVTLNYRNQWPGISGNYVTYSAAYDQYVRDLKGGLGLLVTNDQAGSGTLKTSTINAIYSWIKPITRKVSFSFGFQASYTTKILDWSKLTFGDMIDPKRGFVQQTAEQPGVNASHNFDISSGMLIYSKKFYAGFAAHHLTEPNESLLGFESRLPRKYTGHAGLMIPVSGRDGDTYVSPNILFRKQQDFQQLNLGMYLMRGSIVGGFWYRNQDSFILLLGVQKDIFKIGYSYDVTVSKLSNKTAGAHELSFAMNFKCKKPPIKHRPAICPSF